MADSIAPATPGTESYVWQDREIRFDVPLALLDLRGGEELIENVSPVEDTKGNNDQPGTLMITNLRLIWVANRYPKTNLSVGYNCVIHINVRTATSRLRGNTQALYILTKYNSTRFEFIFTSGVPNCPRLFSTIQAVHRAYESTRLYRDLKLRGSIIHEKELLLLPQEQIYSRVNGVWNLSSDQGNLGTFYITNVRVVWFANMAENFNVSIPYIQIRSVRVRDSKFGLALVIETVPQVNAYVLGFRIDPAEQLYAVATEIQNIHRVFSATPVFGVTFSLEERPLPLVPTKLPRKDDDVEIVEENSDAFAIYYADVNKNADQEPVWSPELGLAIEKLKEGIKLEQLWKVAG